MFEELQQRLAHHHPRESASQRMSFRAETRNPKDRMSHYSFINSNGCAKRGIASKKF